MNTGLGGWMPISRYLKKFLPVDRPYTELEAMYSLQLDFHDGNDASESGYALLWGWSRTRVRNFLSNVSAEISEAKNQRSLGKVLLSLNKTGSDTSRGQAAIQAEDRQKTGRRQARLININKLDSEEDKQRTGSDTSRGQAAIQAEDRQQDTTIESRKEKGETDIQLPPLPPAGGSEAGGGREGEGGGDQSLPPTLPTVSDQPKQTGKGKRVKKETPPESEKFLTFWAAYPNKQGRAKAWEKWAEWKLDSQADAIMAALNGFKRSDGWIKDNGQFVPHGSTWINQRRWLDMAEVAAPKQPAQQNGSAVNMDEMIRKAIEAKRIETCGSDAL